MIRLLAVAYLWVLPMTIKQQKFCFNFLEVSEAWSSLEVFLVVIFGIFIETGPLLGTLTNRMTPNLVKIVTTIFPSVDSLMGAKLKLHPGFWFALPAVILEKIIARLITQQAATAIAERQAELILRYYAQHSDQQNVSDQMTVSNATEGLLETDAAFFFSPAARYTIAPRTLYAGLPRTFWSGFMVRWGLLADADLVMEYGSPSSSLSLDSQELRQSFLESELL